VGEFRRAHRQRVQEALRPDAIKRDECWSQALAVGSQAFVKRVKRELAMKARHRDIEHTSGSYALRQPQIPYNRDFDHEMGALRPKNTIVWDENVAAAYT
jgi:putative transposase